MTAKQVLGLALILLAVVTSEALYIREEHIREHLIANSPD